MSKKPKSIVWPLGAHSRGKHLVLREYLKNWFAIVGQMGFHLQVIDAFAGPGEYTDGSPGSPVIALEEAIRARAPRDRSIMSFEFIEENTDRLAHLRNLLAQRFPTLPSHIKYDVTQGTFQDLSSVPSIAAGQLAPSFTMIDPFGVSQTPMDVVAQLLRNKSSEVFVSLMADYAARYCENPSWEKRLTDLFGTDEWKPYRDFDDHDSKRFAFVQLYVESLKRNGAKYALSIDLYHGRKYKYSIVFGTSHPKGCGVMKGCIWKALGSDEFIASRVAPDQLGLGLDLPLTSRKPEHELTLHLRVEFKGQTVSVDALDAWMHTDTHIYSPTHLRPALKLLEADETIQVVVPNGKRRIAGKFPKAQGYHISFKP